MTKYIETGLEGIDCDLCGYSFDSLEIEEVGPDSYDIYYLAGCYGGDGRAGVSRTDAVEFLKMVRSWRSSRLDRAAISALIRRFEENVWDESSDD